MRTSWMVALGLVTVAAGCADRAPTGTDASAGSTGDHQGGPASIVVPPPPIAVELVTPLRHQFTDDVDAQLRLKLEGTSRHVVNFDPSRMAVARITVQPGARFPWHTHPGPVLVAVTQGDLVYVLADDCVERTYPVGTGLVDPGNNVHYAFNPTAGETVLIATFLGVPASGPLTIPVAAAPETALDGKCGVGAALAHVH
jgi:quercetin dioxygenase-like cupin family protein